MLSITHGASQRFHVLTTVLKYRLAHRTVTGRRTFAGRQDKGKTCYRWAASELDTEYKRVNKFVKDVYRAEDSPQQAFRVHLDEFVEFYELHEMDC